MPSLSQRDQTIPGLAGSEQERGMRERDGEEKRMKLLLYCFIFYFYEVLFLFFLFWKTEDRNDGK